jgi:signal transduction histidine kinase
MTTPSKQDVQKLLERELERERKSRLRAELLLEEKSRQLYDSNTYLKEINTTLSENQQQLVQSEKMASIGILAAGVAHEINNPISYTLSNITVLKDYCKKMVGQYKSIIDQELDADTAFLFQDAMDLIEESLEGLNRVKNIVSDLQGFSRRSDNHRELADINKALQTTLNVLSNQLKYHVELQLDLAELPQVECDISKLHQVFLNIIVNAAQSIEQKGIIKIATRIDNGQITISIADNGCGMSEEVQQQIFSPFFTTKPTGKGTGLGLSLSYNIIKEHGGNLRVESTPGVGTTFFIVIPQDQKHNQSSE